MCSLHSALVERRSNFTMEFKVINMFFVIVFVVAANTVALPRDSSVAKIEPVVYNSDSVHDSTAKDAKVEYPEHMNNDFFSSVRVPCQYEEPTEDPVCQERCFPKGYKFGLCISGVCSCI